MANKDGQVLTRADLTEPKKANSATPTPKEGARLVRAFLGIKNSAVRDAIVSFVEQTSKGFSESHSDGPIL